MSPSIWQLLTLTVPLVPISFLVAKARTSSSFTLPPFALSTSTKRSQSYALQHTSLLARAARDKKKKSGRTSDRYGGEGFGTKRPDLSSDLSSKKKRRNTKNIDFVTFPPLEEDVLKTLVPSLDHSFSGPLPIEICERLDQIYGFANFNKREISRSSMDEGVVNISIGDALKSSKDDEVSSSVDALRFSRTPVSPGDDFADLITADAGRVFTEKIPHEENNQSFTLPSISNLPPFEKFRVMHVDPLVIVIEDFFTEGECDKYISLASEGDDADAIAMEAPLKRRSMTVGKDKISKAQRTSTTWFHDFRTVPELTAKGSRLLGLKCIDRWEEPQTVRYRKTEKFTWHLDALAPSPDLLSLGGQRTATLLVYLTSLQDKDGGSTMFRDLGGAGGPLKVHPQKGSALLFFPAAGGIPNVPFDIRTLHAGEAVAHGTSTEKWIAQMWLREGRYTPTAPEGNTHIGAREAIDKFCSS